MDGKRFDEIAASLSNATSRRGMLRGLAAGGVASALAAVGLGGLGEADAKRRRRHHRHKKTAVEVSTNPVGAVLGAVCDVTNDCGLNLVCAGKKKNKTCQGCPNACSDSGKCCLVGACVLGLDICV